jgi:copper chaperone CopZ
MKKAEFAVPRMYADHHVTEVRRLLGQLAGVSEVYASSAFQLVEVTFDRRKTSEGAIAEALRAAGYLGNLPVEGESERIQAWGPMERPLHIRRSAAHDANIRIAGFVQEVSRLTERLWQVGVGAPAQERMTEE